MLTIKRGSTAYLLFLSMIFLFFQNCSEVAFEKYVDNSYRGKCGKLDAPGVAPKLKWDWQAEINIQAAADPAKNYYLSFLQVMGTPAVADLDGDGMPEVVFVSWSNNAADRYSDSTATPYFANSVLRVVDGGTGRNKFSLANGRDVTPVADPSQPLTTDERRLAPAGSQMPLLMDIDGDGKIEIFYTNYISNVLVAINSDFSLRWKFTLPTNTHSSAGASGVTGSDVNGDGKGEIFVGKWLIHEDSARVPQIQAELNHTNAIHTTAIAIPLDPLQPSKWSLIGYQGLFNADGSLVRAFTEGAFYFAVADIYPVIPGLEIIGTGGSKVVIYNGLTGAVERKIDLSDPMYNDLKCPANNAGGGPSSVGDFDGDTSTLEIAIATGRYLTIFDVDMVPKHKIVTQDCSSLSTGLTSFDLNGDKKPEILYADEEYLRIYAIENGQLLEKHRVINPSWTLREYPVVADVNGDRSTEIIVASNNVRVPYFYTDPDQLNDKATAALITGVRAYESSEPRAWMGSRKIWNQHSFHPDLVSDSGKFFAAPTVNAGLFRANTQGVNTVLTCSP